MPDLLKPFTVIIEQIVKVLKYEGTTVGQLNRRPQTPRPPAPKGQGKSDNA